MINNTAASLNKLTYAQRERLEFIDFCLQYFGDIARNDLIQHFQTGPASCSRDFTQYKALAPNNLELRHEDKRYYRTATFKPVFIHDSKIVLNRLLQGFGDSIVTAVLPSEFCAEALVHIQPDSELLASFTRAIHQQQPLKATYYSLSSGLSQREFIPHSLVNNGQRWHVRGFDRKKQEFRDFVCSRFTELQPIDYLQPAASVQQHELKTADTLWSTWLELIVIPHPAQVHPQAIALDFAMPNADGKYQLTIKLRAAMADYWLRYWQVDCGVTPTAHPAHQLYLLNQHEITQQASLVLAPYAAAKSKPWQQFRET